MRDQYPIQKTSFFWDEDIVNSYSGGMNISHYILHWIKGVCRSFDFGSQSLLLASSPKLSGRWVGCLFGRWWFFVIPPIHIKHSTSLSLSHTHTLYWLAHNTVHWDAPPPSNSHHQDHDTFSRGSLFTFPSHCCWMGEHAKRYDNIFKSTPVTSGFIHHFTNQQKTWKYQESSPSTTPPFWCFIHHF